MTEFPLVHRTKILRCHDYRYQPRHFTWKALFRAVHAFSHRGYYQRSSCANSCASNGPPDLSGAIYWKVTAVSIIDIDADDSDLNFLIS